MFQGLYTLLSLYYNLFHFLGKPAVILLLPNNNYCSTFQILQVLSPAVDNTLSAFNASKSLTASSCPYNDST